MHLEFTLKNGSHERFEVREGGSLKEELTAFLEGGHAYGWVPIGKGDAFVRYDQIVLVRAVDDRG
jgi:hypothetical protein